MNINKLGRREFMAGTASVLVLAATQARAQVVPRITLATQWTAEKDLEVVDVLGKLFTDAGGSWEHMPVPGGTAGLMNKVRADMIAGAAPAASQMKGPDIAAWSREFPTADLDQIVADAGFAELLPKEIVNQHTPAGTWMALPAHAFRMNTLFISTKALERIGETEAPKTWDDYNALASKMVAAGIGPIASGGNGSHYQINFEVVLAGINIDTYRAAIMDLDQDAINSAEVLEAFRQIRRMSEWWDPASVGQSYTVFMPDFIRGDKGMLILGGMAENGMKFAGAAPDDYIAVPTPNNTGGPAAFLLNADSFVFWQKEEEDLKAGQNLLAEIIVGKEFGTLFPSAANSIPLRSDVDVSSDLFTPNQRAAAAAYAQAIQDDTVILSIAENMAHTANIAAPIIEVLSEFITDPAISPEDGQKQLSDVVADVAR